MWLQNEHMPAEKYNLQETPQNPGNLPRLNKFFRLFLTYQDNATPSYLLALPPASPWPNLSCTLNGGGL